MRSLVPRLTAHLAARWWVVFAVVIVVPSLALSLVSLQLISRLVRDEKASLVRNAASVPWYNEAKMNRALAARALHAALVDTEHSHAPAACRGVGSVHRAKLGRSAARHIVTVHGVGYTFVEP